MRNTGLLLVLFCFLFLSSFSLLPAQAVTFSLPTSSVEYGTTNFTADIKAFDFKEIIGAQFTIVWDSSIIQFDSVFNFGHEGFSLDAHFGLMEVSEGVLRFAWYDESLGGVNLQDSSDLFSIAFTVTGAPEEESGLAFTDDPTRREVYDTSFNIVPSAYIDGKLTINGVVSSVQSLNSEVMRIENVSPVPFRDWATVEVFMREPETVRLVIFDAAGKQVLSRRVSLDSGISRIMLDGGDLPASGFYTLQILGNHFYSTQKILKR